MENVKFKARSLTAVLASGRMVKVSRDDEGRYWGFHIGDLDSEDDHIRFALSTEALDAVLDLVSRLRGEAAVLHWLVKAAPQLTPTDGPEAA